MHSAEDKVWQRCLCTPARETTHSLEMMTYLVLLLNLKEVKHLVKVISTGRGSLMVNSV